MTVSKRSFTYPKGLSSARECERDAIRMVPVLANTSYVMILAECVISDLSTPLMRMLSHRGLSAASTSRRRATTLEDLCDPSLLNSCHTQTSLYL
ncbi:hypothetical protein IG631_02547 [Alternaria alternata]|nr:hypothetical protein IG631_02547 [Alternaria alternata]